MAYYRNIKPTVVNTNNKKVNEGEIPNQSKPDLRLFQDYDKVEEAKEKDNKEAKSGKSGKSGKAGKSGPRSIRGAAKGAKSGGRGRSAPAGLASQGGLIQDNSVFLVSFCEAGPGPAAFIKGGKGLAEKITKKTSGYNDKMGAKDTYTFLLPEKYAITVEGKLGKKIEVRCVQMIGWAELTPESKAWKMYIDGLLNRNVTKNLMNAEMLWVGFTGCTDCDKEKKKA